MLGRRIYKEFLALALCPFTGCGAVNNNLGVRGLSLEAPASSETSSVEQLHALFRNPPDEARPQVRWWWFGPAVTFPELQREIDSMKAGGFGGFEVQPSYPLAVDDAAIGFKNLKFLSPEFLDALKFVAKAAKDSGLRFDLTLGSGWPYGGPMFSAAEAAGKLRVTKSQFGVGQKTIECPSLKEGESLIAAFAGNQELTVRENSVQLPDGSASPTEVAFFISSRTGMKVKRPALGAEGYVLDHDNLAAVSKFIETVGKKEIEACGNNPPYSVFCDSLESYGEDWTETFLTQFQKRRGYDLRPLLPALTGDIGPKTLEIRHDWGQTLTELFHDSFVKSMHRLAEDHKTRFRIQAYGTPSAGLFSYSDADLPEGEGYQWHGYRATRYASSASHLMGLSVTSSETFTWLHTTPFRATPLDMKAEADLHFLQGVNQIICHGWPYTAPSVADPGWSFYAAAVFNEKNPWYSVMPDVNRYLTRTSTMLRQGRPANDVAVYLANDDAWAHFTPGHISLSDGVGEQLGKKIVGEILDSGYNLDFFDDQMLDRFGRIDGGRMAFGDLYYKVVVLAGVERIPVSTMRNLEAFARSGGVVIATRREPWLAPGYLTTDAQSQEVRDISQRLFHSSSAPGIFLKDESDFAPALGDRLPPDVRMVPATPQIGVVHRHTNYGEIYFLANTSNQPVTTKATFRVERSTPQQWNSLTGEAKTVSNIDHPPGGNTVDVSLDAYQSTFVIWTGKSPPAIHAATQMAAISPIDLSTNWTTQFGPNAKQTSMQTLHSWTGDDGARNFSGICTYTKHFKIPADRSLMNSKVWLTFGLSTPTRHDTHITGFQADLDPPIRDAAVVYINDHRAGSLWCPPYELNVTPWLIAGDNEIRIEVANTAVNAIAAHRFPNYDVESINAKFGERFNAPKASQFQPVTSGLLGPIQLTVEP